MELSCKSCLSYGNRKLSQNKSSIFNEIEIISMQWFLEPRLHLVAGLQIQFMAWGTPSVKLIGQILADFSAPYEVPGPKLRAWRRRRDAEEELLSRLLLRWEFRLDLTFRCGLLVCYLIQVPSGGLR